MPHSGYSGLLRDKYAVPENLRRLVLQEDSVCQLQGPNCTVESTVVDHIVPLARGGNSERDNLQGLCETCHLEKTREEQRKGRSKVVERQFMQPGYLDVIPSAADKSYAWTSEDKWFNYFGPAHTRGDDGLYILPKHTLGWEVITWIATYLELKGKPFIPTGEQSRFILWAYAIYEGGELMSNGERAEPGQFIYDELMKIAPKGWGKDPLLAMIAACELVGPCRFGGWKTDSMGNKTPIAIDCPGAWFQIGAGSIDQANITFIYLKSIWSVKARKRYQIETLQGPNIWAMGRTRRIEKISSVPDTREGEFPTGVALSELEHGTRRSGMFDLYGVLSRNASKTYGSRVWLITNAYDPSKGSLAQSLLEESESGWAGRVVDPGRMVDAIMATEHAPYATYADRIKVLSVVYGESLLYNKQNLPKHARKFDSTIEPIAKTLAFYYNCVSNDASAAFDMRDWDASPTDKVIDLPDGWPPFGSQITFGFDGSLNDDCTVLIAVVFGGEYDGLHFPVGIWKPRKRQIIDGVREAGILIDRDDVRAKWIWMFEHYKVMAGRADPSHKKDENDIQFWTPFLDEMHLKYGRNRIQPQFWASKNNAFRFDMANTTNNKVFVDQLGKTQAAITDRVYRHTDDEEMRAQFQNARLVQTGWGDQTIGKRTPQSPDKIDAAVGSTLADVAYTAISAHLRKRGMTEGTTR